MPKADPRQQKKRIVLEGEVADPANPPSGCYFRPRCPYAVERCRVERPAFRDMGDRRFVACHRAEELTLRGVAPVAAPVA